MRKDSRMEIRVKLKRDEYERIKKAAEKRGVPIASMVKFVVFKYIEDQEREGKKMWVEDWLRRMREEDKELDSRLKREELMMNEIVKEILDIAYRKAEQAFEELYGQVKSVLETSNDEEFAEQSKKAFGLMFFKRNTLHTLLEKLIEEIGYDEVEATIRAMKEEKKS